MEVVSTVDVYKVAQEDSFQYSVPLEHSEYLVFHEPRSVFKETHKHKKRTPAGDYYSPFGNGMHITSRDIQTIHGIINYLDSKNTLSLAFPSNQKHLKEEGKKIDHVHPLCFIWSIVSIPDMREKLRHFRDNSAFALKWEGFLGYSAFHDKGFGRNMERYYNHRDFSDYVSEFEPFYRVLNLRPEVMNQYASSKQWAQFASALLEQSSYL